MWMKNIIEYYIPDQNIDFFAFKESEQFFVGLLHRFCNSALIFLFDNI